MNRNLPDPIDWQPRRWDEAIGSESYIAKLKDMVRGVRVRNLRRGFRTLATGKPRTGKTCLMRFAIRCLYCQELDLTTLDPCPGTCQACREIPEAYNLLGFQNHSSHMDRAGGKSPIEFHYIPVDCSDDTLTAKVLKDEVLAETRLLSKSYVMIVYLDELHHLAKKGLDSLFLKPTEDHTAIWLATSAYIEPEDVPTRSKTLNEMFLERFTLVRTTLPSVSALAAHLFDRCQEYGVDVEAPRKGNYELWAQRAGQVPYYAMKLLSDVWKRPAGERLITREMIMDYGFTVT